MDIKNNIDNKTAVFNYLRSKKFGKDSLTKEEATQVINNEPMCLLIYLHMKQLKEVYNGEYSTIK